MSLWEEIPQTGENKGTKRSLVVEAHGLPIGITLSGANRHDIKLLEATLQSIVTAHPEGANYALMPGMSGRVLLLRKWGMRLIFAGEEKRNRNMRRIRNSRRGGG